MLKKLLSIITGLCFLFLFGCVASKPAGHTSNIKSPKAPAEFRAAWVASVSNINWPSKPGLSTQKQQQEAIALLDFLKEHHFNAVIFQIRPQTDACIKAIWNPGHIT